MTKIKWTDNKIEKRLKEGYGSGEGKDYKSWLHALEAPSAGTIVRPIGWKTGRIHQLYSRLEFQTFLAYEWSDIVTDIREQYPLERNETEVIANILGIKHPQYSGTSVSTVMTTDLLLTLTERGNKRYIAVSVKPSNKLGNRNLEKLQIEKVYWEKKSIEWAIVTDQELSKIFTENMEYIHRYKSLSQHIDQDDSNDLTSKLINGLQESNLTLRSYFHLFDNKHSLTEGTGILLFRYCLANKFITMNMKKPLNLSETASTVIKDKEQNPNEVC